MKKRIKKITLPIFEKEEIVRKKITFTGKVKRVGFRNEVILICNHVGVVGFIYNTKTGVNGELEGTEKQIDYVISHLKNIPRFIIKDIVCESVSIINEKKFYKK